MTAVDTLPDELSQEAFAGFEQFEPTPGSKTEDPNAPYGVTSTGVPRGKPGRKPAAKKAAAPRKAPAIPGLAKKAGPRVPPPPKKTAIDYGPALTAMAGQLIGPVAVVGLVRNDIRLIADAATVANALPAIVEGANLAADQFPVVAAILDKVCKVGPYAGLMGGLGMMVGQIAVNHGLIPAGLIPGTLPPAKLAEKFVRDQAAASEEFAMLLESLSEKRNAQNAEAAA